MEKVTPEEARKIQLFMLREIDTFCRANNIRYSLSGGSLLGAVRHKGFIPWDDDIDIFMPRPDYERFVVNFYGKVPYVNVFSYQTSDTCMAKFAKVYDERTFYMFRNCVYGVFIDVFPIDGIPAPAEAAAYAKKFNRMGDHITMKRKCYKQSANPVRDIAKYIVKQIMMPLPKSYLVKKFNEYLNQYPFETSKYRGCIINMGPYGTREFFPAKVFDEFIDMPFENLSVSCLKEYDKYLSQLFGDYMTPPPVEKQVPGHDYPTYWKEGFSIKDIL